MFKTRLISGIILILASLAAVLLGRGVLFVAVFVVSLVGMSEFYKVFGIRKKLPGICGYLFAASYDLLLFFRGKLHRLDDWILMLLMASALFFMALLALSYPRYQTEQIFAAFFGIFYVAAALSYVFRITFLEKGGFCVWLIFICSWGCDTCAYCVGKLFGRHRMASILSPRKSVEGGIGGILGAALLAFLYGVFINRFALAKVSVASYAIIGAFGGAISQIGDLAASAVKRFHGVKDYGKIIPGHGGVLDRFDSVLFTAPFIYYLFAVL